MRATAPTPEAPAPPGASERLHLTYQPALDGIRACAVVAVMLYHGGVSWARGGFLGVDAFFVLSGFLITSLLLREHGSTGRIALGAFWSRRARRLLPALFLALLLIAALAPFLHGWGDPQRLRSDGLATLFYVQNWHQILTHQSYFAQFAAPSPLQHAWSLAIEEQFYLVWPLLLLFLLRVTRRRLGLVLLVTLALAIASAIWMAVLFPAGHDPSRVYFGTDTRAQSILAGAALAIVLRIATMPRATWFRWGLRTAGLLAGVATLFFWGHVSDVSARLYRGGFLVAAVAVVVVIADVVQADNHVLRPVLGWKPLRAIGWISYGLYLYHWPIFVLVDHDRTGIDSDAALLAVRFALTFAIAIVSYRFVEQPIRHGRLVGGSMRAALPATAVVVLVALVATSVVSPRPAAAFAPPTAPNAADPDNPFRVNELMALSRALASPATKQAVVVGDSVAFTMSEPRPSAQLDVWGAGTIGCGVMQGQIVVDGRVGSTDAACVHQPAFWRQVVAQLDPDVSVVLVGTWAVYDRDLDGRLLRFGTPAFDAEFRRELQSGIDTLSSRGGAVMLLTTPCMQPSRDHLDYLGLGEALADPWRIDHLGLLERQVASANPRRVTLVDLHAHVCPAGRYTSRLGGVTIRESDGVHFAPQAEPVVWAWLGPQVEALAASTPRYRARVRATGAG